MFGGGTRLVMHNLTATSEPRTPRRMLANAGMGLKPSRMAGGWEQQLKWVQSGSSK